VTARKRFGYVCAAFGVVLVVMGLASIWAFVGGKYPDVPEDVKPAVSRTIQMSSPGSGVAGLAEYVRSGVMG